MPAQTELVPATAHARVEGERMLVELTGRWRITEPHPGWQETLGKERPKSVKAVLRQVETWDSALLLFLFEAARWCRKHEATFDTSELPENMRALLDQLQAAKVKVNPPQNRGTLVSSIGVASLNTWSGAKALSRFIGELTLSAASLAKRPRKFRWQDCLHEMQQCGAMSLPIVSLISFLVGVTLAYTAAIILRQFGADIWVADLVGMSMTREMGAMMTGVVLAGRTGAAFAAQIGNMKANEEIDALVTLGFSPVDFLVMPRVLALALMMPLLAMYSNCLGILGGMVVAQGLLDISPTAYWIEMLTIVDMSDVTAGLIKAATFGVIIGLAGCMRGLQTERSAAGVGKAATSAVVTSILMIVVADAIYAVVFNILGI